MYLRLVHWPIRKRTIYWLTVIGALVTILGLIDSAYFSFSFTHKISDKIGLHWYALLFGFPHIFASLTSFQVKGHVKAYPKKSWIQLFIILSVLLTIFLFSSILFSIIFLILVSSHITGQSLGLLNFWSTDFQKIKKIWFYLNSVTLAVGLINIFTGDLKLYLNDLYPLFIEGGLVLSAINFLITFYLVVKESNKTVKWLFILTQINLFGLFYLPVLSNIFFSTLLFILNHDLIAFYFYFSHRLSATKSFINTVGMLVTIIILTGIIGWYILFFKVPQIILIFQVIHYLVEKRIWKSNSPHRQFIKVVS